MARKKYYIGSLGPFFYDDAKAIDDPDGDFAGEDNKAIVTDGQFYVGTAPTDNQHVLRKADVGTAAGDVIGPAASTDEAIARYDGVSGKSLQDSLVTIDDAGAVVFLGTGLCFGSCYVYHSGWSQANCVQNTWYNVSAVGFNSGPLNQVTHDGNGELTVLKAGTYKIDASFDWENDTVNDHIEFGFEINGSGSAHAHGIICNETKFANEEHVGSITAIIALSANDTIEFCVRTIDNNTPTISVECVNLNCVQLGG